MLIFGADVIGDSDISEHQYIGLVIGTEESVNRLHNRIGLDKEIHMRELSDNQKTTLYQRIDFTDNDIESWCMHVDRQNIIDTIKLSENLHPRFKRGKLIQRHFDNLLLKKIKQDIENFTIPYGKHIEDLTMQCDGDMIRTAQNWKMGTEHKGRAYQLADAIVYCRQRRHNVPGWHVHDFRDDLLVEMGRDLLR